MTNDETRNTKSTTGLNFVIRSFVHSFVIRHSSFVITASLGALDVHEQLVRQNAEAIDRRGLNAENDRAKRDRAAAVAARQRKLGRRKVAFGTDEHENARGPIAMFRAILGQDFLEMDGVGLERANQLKI